MNNEAVTLETKNCHIDKPIRKEQPVKRGSNMGGVYRAIKTLRILIVMAVCAV